MGRPWKGNVEEEDGREGDVFVKKSIFRLNKKFWGKRIFAKHDDGRFDKEF